jgi:enoyl-CoA hydratase/carnithine racemase
MSATPQVRCEVSLGVAQLTLHHPKRFNAMSRRMWRQLREQVLALQADPTLRLIWLRGEGGHFCAGGDISEYTSFRFQQDSLRAFHEGEVWGALAALLACDVPLLAQIDGHCMGAGLELACCCDLRIASDSAQFGAPIARLGFPMAPRELALVGREVGLMTARQMLLEAAVLGAPEMALRGFLSRVVAQEDLAAVSHATVERMRQLAPQAARLNKQTIRKLFMAVAPVDTALTAMNIDDFAAPWLAQAYAYADSAEHREGITAFLEKRPPRF